MRKLEEEEVLERAGAECIPMVPKDVPEEITEADEKRFFQVISTDLTPEQAERISVPQQIYPRQENVLAVHWHPEFVPMNLIEQRIETVFPHRSESLIIPTQHNEIMTYGGYAGVEVDCYSREFNQKVQLLLHFREDRVADAPIFREMLAHTFKYRSSQLFEFIRTITYPIEERLSDAAAQTGANTGLIRFVRIYVKKIETLLDRHMDTLPPQVIKNKILRNYFDALRVEYGDSLIQRAQTFLTAVKKIVKSDFSFQYFYRTQEIIEEARSLGAGIVIPHPEQFWPILLAEYDVDGYEVWNPQSLKYTGFLISVLKEKNRNRAESKRELLMFMGDDTHMGEKVKEPAEQNPEKAAREIGVQPAWEDLSIRKTLIKADFTRKRVIEAYKSRLD